MNIFRILGLIGSASCLVYLIYYLEWRGIPNRPREYWIAGSLALVAFNFFPVPKTISGSLIGLWKNSLIGLWVEANKKKLRKEINED